MPANDSCSFLIEEGLVCKDVVGIIRNFLMPEQKNLRKNFDLCLLSMLWKRYTDNREYSVFHRHESLSRKLVKRYAPKPEVKPILSLDNYKKLVTKRY
jgi:hypothetical protein